MCSQFPASGCCCYRSRRILTPGSEFVDVKTPVQPRLLTSQVTRCAQQVRKKVTKVVPGYPPRQHIPLREITASNLKAETNHTAWVCKEPEWAARELKAPYPPRNRVQWCPAERRASHVGVKMPPRRRLGRFDLKMHFFPVHWLDGAFNATKAVALEEKKLQFVGV